MNRFSNSLIRLLFKRRQNQFSERDVPRVLYKQKKIRKKFQTKGFLIRFRADALSMVAMLNDYYHRRYLKVPWYIISAIGAALLYVLIPVDLLPDFIPVVGYIDDASVFGLCLDLVGKELQKYRLWTEQNKAVLPEDKNSGSSS